MKQTVVALLWQQGLKMRKNEDHNDSVKQKCLLKIQLRTTFSCYSRKHAYAKYLYHMYWSIFQHIKTAGWTKENLQKFLVVQNVIATAIPSTDIALKLRTYAAFSMNLSKKNHDPGMSKMSSKDPQNMQIFVIFGFQFSVK